MLDLGLPHLVGPQSFSKKVTFISIMTINSIVCIISVMTLQLNRKNQWKIQWTMQIHERIAKA